MGCTPARRASASASTAASTRLLTGPLPRRRSSLPASGCGSAGHWTRRSSGSSAPPSTRRRSRSAGYSNPRISLRATPRASSAQPRSACALKRQRSNSHCPLRRLVSEAQRAIDAVWRIESARVIAGLARIVGDVGLAEDLAQDALVAALEQWPESGVPDKPGAWLMAIAKRRWIDQLRRQKMQGRKHEHLGRELDERQVSPEPELAAAIDDHVGDDLLSLIFTEW